MTDEESIAARDYLIDEGIRLGTDPFDAASILMTAGFSILTAAVGIETVKAMAPGMIGALVEDLPKVN